MAVRIIENVPADQVDKYVRLLSDGGATKIQKRAEPDGEFTLVVTYPETGKLVTVHPA